MKRKNKRQTASNLADKSADNELIRSLLAENAELKKQLDLANATVSDRIKAADEKIALDYSLEIKRLYAFAARWQAALPFDDTSCEKRLALAKALQSLFQDHKTLNSSADGEELIARATALLTEKQSPAPQSDGFDLNEVLNPGELDLEALCKELGVMD